MFLILITGLLLVGASIALVARAAAIPRIRAAERIGDIGAYGFPADGRLAAAAEAGVRLDGVARSLGETLIRRFGLSTDDAATLLARAGHYETKPEAFIGYRFLSAATATGVWLWLAASGAMGAAMMIFGLAIAGVAGWVVPQAVVRRRGDQRLAKIEYGLPEMIDALVVMVEAGLGFTGSLQVAASRLTGPLGEEIRLALQEQRMGLSMSAALNNLLQRAGTPSMRSFVRSVSQSETLGVSIGEIMRNLAVEMRKRRRQSAEERANKAPIKILFPLVFLIFPAMFIVLLYPAFHTFTESFNAL